MALSNIAGEFVYILVLFVYQITLFSPEYQVVASWACILILGTIKFLQATALLSSWKGVAVSAALMAVVTVLMQILINFSKSERSTAAKVAPAKEKNVNQPTGNGQEKKD